MIIIGITNEHSEKSPICTEDLRRSTKMNFRPIIFSFVSYRRRKEVFKANKLLKGRSISFSNNLTKSNYELYKAAMAKYGRISAKFEIEYFISNSHDDL